MNIFPLCGTYLYVNRRTNFKCKNIFVGMVTRFKNNSQLDRSVSTFFLTYQWNYCTQSAQCFHALPQDISKSSIKFEYILYKLCVLLVMNDKSSKD